MCLLLHVMYLPLLHCLFQQVTWQIEKNLNHWIYTRGFVTKLPNSKKNVHMYLLLRGESCTIDNRR